MYTLYKKGTTDKKKTASNGINFYKNGRCTSPRTIFLIEMNRFVSLCLKFMKKLVILNPILAVFNLKKTVRDYKKMY